MTEPEGVRGGSLKVLIPSQEPEDVKLSGLVAITRADAHVHTQALEFNPNTGKSHLNLPCDCQRHMKVVAYCLF